MRRRLTTAFSLGAILILCGAASGKVPEEVATHIQRMTKECKTVGGTPLADKFSEHAALADGMEFWVINEGAFHCDGAASLFLGSGGSQVVVYLSLPNGHARQIFAHGAYGMTVERRGLSAKLWLVVGGPLCGQDGNPTHAGGISCERPLKWDAKAQRLDFAPLSAARPSGHSISDTAR
jgi:hypothetical protein